MNDFFANLIDRHRGTSNTIQPRTLGRFEVERGRMSGFSPDNSANLVVSEDNQMLKQSSEVSYEIPKETASEINAPKVTIQKPDPTGNKKDYSSSSLLKQRNPSANTALTEQHTTRLLDLDREIHATDINDFREVMEEKETSLPQHSHEYHSEPELNYRIRSMLQRLSDEPVSSTIEPISDDLSSQKNETKISITPEINSPFLDASITSLDLTNNLKQQIEEKISADDRENTTHYGWLETPSWLSEIEAQFNQRLKETVTNPNPVINVTIGRVEVRAVQSERPKQAKRQKKPTGVMSLDDYLKQRKDGGRS